MAELNSTKSLPFSPIKRQRTQQISSMQLRSVQSSANIENSSKSKRIQVATVRLPWPLKQQIRYFQTISNKTKLNRGSLHQMNFPKSSLEDSPPNTKSPINLFHFSHFKISQISQGQLISSLPPQ
ncbi:hypothetical protein FGO68_gene3917 [Halteria grandinella]|uniref:Uncharacterized protein n=1 Tax=Halteria grandinella TaxID=5974 RepID=A0A8J8P7L4_HALGN|nr:hypothetical protein FGO68_gene3917 [Halteria grandinella]